ncbi:Glycosyl transferase [Chitinispirillum alkaliphilum]|nr:Glycosyl transferase [Chitinispirillum alkaliphilum]
MKIAFFSRYLPSDEPNGVSYQVHRLACFLVTSGHKVVVYSFSPAPDDANYEHVRLPWKYTLKFIRKFIPALTFRKINTSEFDVLHYHGDDYLCKGSGKRVRTFYGSALREAQYSANIKRFFYQALFYLFELVSCLRKGKKNGISKDTVRCLPFVSKIIPCSVPVKKFITRKSKTPYPTILFAGTFYTRKRGELLIDAFKRVVLPALPDCRLRIVGPQPCCGKNIDYLGRLEDSKLIEEYSSSWVYCMCSSYEGFGVPVIEAMAGGAAVVATHNHGTDQIITSGIDGMLCEPNDLGKTLLRVLSDTILREKLRNNGFATALKYSQEVIGKKYESWYCS